MPRITELLAFVIEDTGPDDEGVPAFVDRRTGYLMPLLGADRDRMESLRGKAQEAADRAGKPIRLMRSTGLELVETIEPRRPPMH